MNKLKDLIKKAKTNCTSYQHFKMTVEEVRTLDLLPNTNEVNLSVLGLNTDHVVSCKQRDSFICLITK